MHAYQKPFPNVSETIHMRTILVLTLAVAMIGCGNDDVITSPTPLAISGEYALSSIDGVQLPATVLDLGAYRLTLASGSLKLNADSSYLIVYGLRVDDSGNVRFDSDSDSGRWSAKARTLSMQSTGGNDRKTGIAFGDSVMLQSSTRTLVYKK